MEPNKKNEEIIEGYDYLGNSASTTDCTGLMPTLPRDRSELESYEDVFHFRPTAAKNQE